MDFFQTFFFNSSFLIAHDVILRARLFDCFVIVIIILSFCFVWWAVDLGIGSSTNIIYVVNIDGVTTITNSVSLW